MAREYVFGNSFKATREDAKDFFDQESFGDENIKK